MEWSGLAETAYRSGIKELIDNGYLVNTKGNYYTFYEHGALAGEEQHDARAETVNVFNF